MAFSQAEGALPNDQSGKFNRRSAAQNLNGATGVSYAPGGGNGNARWKLYHMQIKLVTTATAGSRLILVQLRDGNNNVVHEFVNSGTYGTGRTVVAGTTERYEITIFSDGASKGITLTTLMNAPYIMGQSTSTNIDNIFIKDTAAIDAADQVSAEIEVEEWTEI